MDSDEVESDGSLSFSTRGENHATTGSHPASLFHKSLILRHLIPAPESGKRTHQRNRKISVATVKKRGKRMAEVNYPEAKMGHCDVRTEHWEPISCVDDGFQSLKGMA